MNCIHCGKAVVMQHGLWTHDNGPAECGITFHGEALYALPDMDNGEFVTTETDEKRMDRIEGIRRATRRKT